MNTPQNEIKSEIKKEKIVLALLPYWTPQIPPLGISCLKAFLQKHGYTVKTVDLNVEETFSKVHAAYFGALKEYIPVEQQGNLFNVGHDVLRNQMMAHLNRQDDDEYSRLVEILVYENFYCQFDKQLVAKLVEIISGFYEALDSHIRRLFQEENPTVFGLSVFDGTLPASLFAGELAKKLNPAVKVVIGGGVFAEQLAAGTPDWDFLLEKTPFVDAFIIGEGENLFLRYLQGQLPGGRKRYTLDDIGRELMDLSSTETPDFSDLDVSNYPVISTYASRSCPFQCSFCSETVQWGKYRKKHHSKIVSEMKELSQKHDAQLFLMGDSLLNPVADGLSNEIIDQGLSLYWDGYLRADLPVCNTDNTYLWRRGGFYRARLGIESGSQRILDAMDKKVTTDQVRAAIYSLGSAGIKTTTYWVVGYPGETEEDFQQTLNLLDDLKDDIYEAWASPFFYYATGQVRSNRWDADDRLLFPDWATKMLVIRTWVLDTEPQRQEAFDRVARFVRHCHKLKIPTPSSLKDISAADERWTQLHKNAVPSLLSFQKDGNVIDENRNVHKINLAQSKNLNDLDFDL